MHFPCVRLNPSANHPHLYALDAYEVKRVVVVAAVGQQLLHKGDNLRGLILVRPVCV